MKALEKPNTYSNGIIATKPLLPIRVWVAFVWQARYQKKEHYTPLPLKKPLTPTLVHVSEQ